MLLEYKHVTHFDVRWAEEKHKIHTYDVYNKIKFQKKLRQKLLLFVGV